MKWSRGRKNSSITARITNVNRGIYTYVKSPTKQAPLVSRIKTRDLVRNSDLRRVHLVVKLLSPRKVIPEVPLAGHLKDFPSSWKKLIKDQEILPVVKGYKMPFITALYQDKAPQNIYMSLAKETLVYVIKREMLAKEAISLVQESKRKGS